MNNQRKRVGFTIVELIIAVTVIGILAALTIVGYRGVQERGRSASASAAAKDASGKLKLYKFDNGAYPPTSSLSQADITDGNGVTYQYTSDGSTYCLTATNKNVSYKISQDTTPVAGGCPGHNSNGATVITNLASNPSATSNVNGVTGYYGSPVTRDATSGYSGMGAFLTTTNSTANPQGMIFTITTAAAANQQYTCSLAMGADTTTQVYLSGRPATSADAYITEGLGSKTITLGPGFERNAITFTTPATTGILRIQVRLVTPADGVSILADAIMCTTGATDYKFADGNTANWSWMGTANNSSSYGPPV